VVIGGAVAAFTVCCVLPIGYLLIRVLGSASGALEAVVLDRRQRGLLYNTAILGIGTAGLSTAIGASLGIVLARVPMRGNRTIRLLATVPVLLPPYVLALAWTFLGSSRGLVARLAHRDLLSEWTYSLPAAILVLSVAFYPLSMLATEAALRRVDGRLEEAGLIVAPPGRVLRHITLPLVAPNVMAAALIIFVLAISEFGVPGMLRVRVYTTEVFTAFAALYDSGRAVVLAIPLLLLSLSIAAAAALLLGERLVTTRRSSGASPLIFHDLRGLAAGGVVFIIATVIVLPTLILVREATAARSPAAAIVGSVEAIANSVTFASAGATLVVAMGVWLGYAQARAGRAVRLAAQVALVALSAVPSTIVGVGLIGLWNRPGPLGVLYGTEAMLLVGYLARFVPIATLILAATTRAVPISQEEAAAVHGAGWLRTFGRIVSPQMRLGMSAAWVVAFVLAFGELGVSILVAPPGDATLPIRIYTIIANTPPSTVAMLALLQSTVVFLAVAVFGAATLTPEAR
jgi:iron(III) transport system permease protein